MNWRSRDWLVKLLSPITKSASGSPLLIEIPDALPLVVVGVPLGVDVAHVVQVREGPLSVQVPPRRTMAIVRKPPATVMPASRSVGVPLM